MLSLLPGSSSLLPPPAQHAPAPASPDKCRTTSAPRPFAAPAPHSSALFSPSLSEKPSPAKSGLLRPAAETSPDPRLSNMPYSQSALLAYALLPFTVPGTDPHALVPLRDWSAVLAPPPPASVSGLVLPLAVVYIPPREGVKSVVLPRADLLLMVSWRLSCMIKMCIVCCAVL